MPTLPPFLEYSLSFISYFKYFFVFLGAVIEGPIVMIASGFLLSLGTFEAVPLFASLLLGDLVGDIIWYYIGYYFAGFFINKYGKFFGLKPELFEKVKTVFYKYHTTDFQLAKAWTLKLSTPNCHNEPSSASRFFYFCIVQ